MKIKQFMKMMGSLEFDEEKQAFYAKSEYDIEEFIHSEYSNFKVGDRVKKVDALDIGIPLYETANNTEGILITSIYIDEMEECISLVKFSTMKELVATKETKLKLIE